MCGTNMALLMRQGYHCQKVDVQPLILHLVRLLLADGAD
jgi:hypothetical protein